MTGTRLADTRARRRSVANLVASDAPERAIGRVKAKSDLSDAHAPEPSIGRVGVR